MKPAEIQNAIATESYYGLNMALVIASLSDDERNVLERLTKICEAERLCVKQPLTSIHLGDHNPQIDKVLELNECPYDLIVENQGTYYYFYHDNFVAINRLNHIFIHAKL